MSKPNISFRDDPEVIQLLKEELGEQETASAVRAAIRHTLFCQGKNCNHFGIIGKIGEISNRLMEYDLTIGEAAKILGKRYSVVHNWVVKNKLRYIRIGSSYRLRSIDIDKMTNPKVTQA